MPAWGGGVREFFADRENNDLSLYVFSAPSRWLCIQSLVGTAPASNAKPFFDSPDVNSLH